jgi:septum formation protein
MSDGPEITLASASQIRAAVLRGAGVSFQVFSPGVDEAAMKVGLLEEGASPRDIADALAELKSVRAARSRGGLVIGADQTLDLDGALYDKVDTLEEAEARLRLLRGKVHKLHAAVVVCKDGAPIWREVVTTKLSMRPFTDAFLDGYLQREGSAILSSVGCYRLEAEGLQLFDRIEGDYFAILGLPMIGLLDLLRRHGALPL